MSSVGKRAELIRRGWPWLLLSCAREWNHFQTEVEPAAHIGSPMVPRMLIKKHIISILALHKPHEVGFSNYMTFPHSFVCSLDYCMQNYGMKMLPHP